MKKPLRPSFYWKAPCLVLVAFIFFHSKAWLIAKARWPGFGPFKVSVENIEAQNVSPREVYEGYDRHFQVDFDVTGQKPDWWMQKFYPDDDKDSKGKRMAKWHFWLERGGKSTRFPVSKSIIWESYWNEVRQGYSNDFAFYSGAVPTNAALKVQGIIQLIPEGYNSPYRFPYAPPPPPMSIVLTLKKAGEKWEVPRVSTDPGCVVKQVKIARSNDGNTVVPIISQGDKLDNVVQKPKFLDSQGRPISSISIVPYPKRDNFFPSTYQLSWSSSALGKASQRDIILHVVLGVGDMWPLEVAFPVKKDGKPLFGVVPILNR